MGTLTPLAQPRSGVRNPVAARPAMVLLRKVLLFIRGFVAVATLATLAKWAWDVNAFSRRGLCTGVPLRV